MGQLKEQHDSEVSGRGSVLITSHLPLGFVSSVCPSVFLYLEQREPNWVSDFLAYGLLALVRELGTITPEDKTCSGSKARSYERKAFLRRTPEN